jgi:tetrahydromethanopterin S-methyltransferase subunit G
LADDAVHEPVPETLLVAVIELRGAIGELTQAVRALTGRFDQIEQRLDGVERRLNQRLDDVEERLGQTELQIQHSKTTLWFIWLVLLPVLAAGLATALKVWNLIKQ